MTEEEKKECQQESQPNAETSFVADAGNTVPPPIPDAAVPPQNKFPDNLIARCKLVFYLVDKSQYQNEITIPMNRIEHIQNHMSNSMQNKDGVDVIYMQGSKNSQSDFTIIPAKNILYMKLEVEEVKTI